MLDGETGQPVAGALVTLEATRAFYRRVRPARAQTPVRVVLTVRTDLNGRYKFRSLRPGTFYLSFRGGPGGVATAVIDELKVGRQQTVEVPPVRLAKGATVTVRLHLQ